MRTMTELHIITNCTLSFNIHRFGRKKTVVVGLVVAFIASIISVSIPDDRSNDGNYILIF